MSNHTDVSRGLEEASQKHEREIVIDLAADRFLHYIGVYLVAFLAVVAKITELAGINLSCYPFGNTSVRTDFILYATTYCWESSAAVSAKEDNGCSSSYNLTVSGLSLLKNPNLFKGLIQWIPYIMIIESLIFAVPSICWHFCVGARLMGHLKFMQRLLGEMYEQVKRNKFAIYKKHEAYDKDSYYLNGWKGFKAQYWNKDKNGESTDNQNEKESCWQHIRKRFRKTQDNGRSESDTSLERSENAQSVLAEDNGKNNQDGLLTKFLLGGIRDRHLFSMLCFENFSSLEHIPYILSTFTLSRAHEEYKKDEAGTLPRVKGILRLVCNENNFCGRFLVKAYLAKHMFGTLMSLLVLSVTIGILYTIGVDEWNAENFRCDMVYHMNICMICTLRRKRDMIAYLAANLLVNVIYVSLSFTQWILLRKSEHKATSHYFEEISVYGSVALNETCNDSDDEDDQKKKSPCISS